MERAVGTVGSTVAVAVDEEEEVEEAWLEAETEDLEDLQRCWH